MATVTRSTSAEAALPSTVAGAGWATLAVVVPLPWEMPWYVL